MSTETGARVPGGCSGSWISRKSWDYRSIAQTGQSSEPCPHMRRLVAFALVCALALTFVGTPATRAAVVASSWSVGAAPFGLALDASTGRVYVANSASSVYDINNPSAPPRGLISVVDPASGSVGRILTSLTSNFVVVDSASRRLYSSNATYSANQESTDVFDLDSGAQVASISGVGGLMPALDVAAGRLFAGGHGLSVIDTATNTVVLSMPSPAGGGAWFGAAVDIQRHRLFLTDGSNSDPRLFMSSTRTRSRSSTRRRCRDPLSAWRSHQCKDACTWRWPEARSAPERSTESMTRRSRWLRRCESLSSDTVCRICIRMTGCTSATTTTGATRRGTHHRTA